MPQDTRTIRQMCDTFDVTARALRFYEQKGLLGPRRIGQRRLYSRRDRARLRLILKGKRFGFSLEEIRSLLELYEGRPFDGDRVAHAADMARRRLSQMRRERDDLDRAIDDLARRVKWAEGRGARASARHAAE